MSGGAESPAAQGSTMFAGFSALQHAVLARTVGNTLVFLFCVAAAIGFAMLCSAAGGALEPWTLRQVARFGVSIMLMLAVAVTDIRIWLRYAYLLYFLVLVLLVAVELKRNVLIVAHRNVNNMLIRNLLNLTLEEGYRVESKNNWLYVFAPRERDIFLVELNSPTGNLKIGSGYLETAPSTSAAR